MRALLLAALMLTCAAAAGLARAQEIPASVHYQGLLTDAGGTPVTDGVHDLKFNLFSTPTGGQSFWSMGPVQVQTHRGIFSTALQPLTAQMLPPAGIWLQITADGAPVLPRTPLHSAPFALKAWSAVNSWSLAGNAGSDGAFLGTTDQHPLVLKVHSARALRIEPAGNTPNIIGGHAVNTAQPGAEGVFIGGGGGPAGAGWEFPVPNLAFDSFCTIGGGEHNVARGLGSAISGGTGNAAVGKSSAVSGGRNCSADGDFAAVGGGEHNIAGGTGAFIGAGRDNLANKSFCSVGGGDYSFAAGRRAAATAAGSFVWADSQDYDFTATAADEFSVRATGGVRLVTALDASGQPSAGVSLGPWDTGWNILSDRAAKTDMADISGREVLEKLAGVRVQTWRLKGSAGPRHMGPMAQDFYAAFGLGSSAAHINTVDADGVALAAIQALYTVVQEQAAELRALRAELQRISGRSVTPEAAR